MAWRHRRPRSPLRTSWADETVSEEKKSALDAVVDSAVSRLRPVALAAATTILGMAPLFPDAFFVSMAVTVAFGLGFATVLTMIVVPVLYSIFFGVQST